MAAGRVTVRIAAGLLLAITTSGGGLLLGDGIVPGGAPAATDCRKADVAVWGGVHTIETAWATWVGDAVVAGCVGDIRSLSETERLRLQAAFERVIRERDLSLIVANGDPSMRANVSADLNTAVGRDVVRDWWLRMSRGDISGE